MAVSRSAAPETLHSSSLVAPSPSYASILVRFIITQYSASRNVQYSAESTAISGFPAWPDAMSRQVSLVDWSPSTDRQLYVTLTTSDSAFCSSSGEMAASVVMQFRVVAMLGWIMPLPFAMPPRRQVTPPSENSTAISLANVSVVMIATAASCAPAGLASSCLHSAGSAA